MTQEQGWDEHNEHADGGERPTICILIEPVRRTLCMEGDPTTAVSIESGVNGGANCPECLGEFDRLRVAFPVPRATQPRTPQELARALMENYLAIEQEAARRMQGATVEDTGWRPNFPVARRVSMQDEARRLVVELVWLVSRETLPSSTRPMRKAARDLRLETAKRLEAVLDQVRGIERKEVLPEGALGLSVGQLQERYTRLRREYCEAAGGPARAAQLVEDMHEIHEVLYRIAVTGNPDFEHVMTTVK